MGADTVRAFVHGFANQGGRVNAMSPSSTMVPLDTLKFPLWGSRLIEASAGTGKTYTIAGLYVRLVLGHGLQPGQSPLTPPEILVTTFTRAATRELRERIRKRLNEAAGFFLEQSEGDDFLQKLRADYDKKQWPGRALQLQIAAQWMDEAAVDTIDAWCFRMLREHAFDSASLFNVELDADSLETVIEATQDYWRLFIAPLDAENFARVSEVIGSCERFAKTLTQGWLAHADTFTHAHEPLALISQVRSGLEACKKPWLEWVPQMRELLEEAYKENRYKKGSLAVNNWRKWLTNIEEWANSADAVLPFDEDGVAWLRLSPESLAAIWLKGSPPQHPGFQALQTLRQEVRALDPHLEGVFRHAAIWVKNRVAELREQRATLSFSSLTEKFNAALQGPNGERLAQLIRRQFPAALIDEFQDTNPIQYQIYDRIYGVDTNREDVLLALIGDPKQAIYAFRGADIHAYLAARRACEGRIYTLNNNYRSTPSMVAAVNHLFEAGEQQRENGAFLFARQGTDGSFENPVPFHPVDAARDRGEFRVEGRQYRALTIWCDTRQDVPNQEARRADVAGACASEILHLLQLGLEGKAGFQSEDGFEALQARDIAILVNTRDEAEELRKQLAQRGIRSVYLSDQSSVYTSEAAVEMLAWLRACAEPEIGKHVRAALATPSLGLSWLQLDKYVHDEMLWESVLERFATYKEQWRHRGLLPMLRRFMYEFGVPGRLFALQKDGSQDGERHLTDLLHLAEMLQAASTSLDGEHAVIRYLEEKIQAGGAGNADEDVSRLRLESDADLVQIVTVHKAKGLEYPLVFYPYGYYCRPTGNFTVPVLYRDERGEPHILASSVELTPQLREQIHTALERERLAEDLRKLYVALTRARYATWMAVSPYRTLAHSAMGYLLGGPEVCTLEHVEGALHGLVEGCDNIAVLPLPESVAGWYRPVGDEGASAPVWRSMTRRIEQRWNLSSYSSLNRLAKVRFKGAPDLALDEQALPDEPGLDTFMEGYLAETAGAEAGEADTYSRQSPLAVGLHKFPKGAAAGSFLHGLLEWVYTQGPQQVLGDPERLQQYVERRCRVRGWSAHSNTLVSWVTDFFTQGFRLAPTVDTADLVLCELKTVLPEMEFWFGVRDADLPKLDALVSRYYLPGQPRSVISRGRLHGLLRGFIDLTFEHQGKYYVADYKSNWLGVDADAYHAQALADAILEHRYDLQAALYLFALHRLLKTRRGEDYEYERHVGGALVFFVRGYQAGTQGVHIERPPLALMEQMEALFSGDTAQAVTPALSANGDA